MSYPQNRFLVCEKTVLISISNYHRSLGRIAAAGWSAEGEGSPGDFRSSARRHDLRTPTGGRRRVGRLRAKEVRGTSAARPDDAAYAIASAIAALRWSAVPKQGNGLPCGGVGGECQTGASYEKHSSPLHPCGAAPLAGGPKTCLPPQKHPPTGQPPFRRPAHCSGVSFFLKFIMRP